MAREPIVELGELATAAGVVAAFAIPVGMLAGWITRACGVPLLPRWRTPAAPDVTAGMPTGSFDLAAASVYACLLIGVPALQAAGGELLEAIGVLEAVYGPADPDGRGLLHNLWGVVLAAPVVLGLWVWYRVRIGRGVWPSVIRMLRAVAVGTAGWAALTPAVFAVHLLANTLTRLTGHKPGVHSLTELGAGVTPGQRTAFGIIVCLLTPVVEEVLFRGLPIGWVAGRRYRAWVPVGLAAAIAATAPSPAGPVGFVAVLAVGLGLLQRFGRRWRRLPLRTTVAVYSTAALFAAAHSAVWPTPVPLFLLGLGLGYLALRTDGVAACVVLHGLFNAVSYVYLLRGGAG